MKTPEGMTEDDVIKTMERVINRIAPKYTFYGYTVDDIKQESYIICIDALSRYDTSRPLENFLSVNLSNRLKNFIRDNYFMSDSDNERIRVMQPAQLNHENTIIDEAEKYSINESEIDYNHLSNLINNNLPASMRMDYLKIINDVYVTKSRKEEVIIRVQEILLEAGYEEGPNI